MARKAPEYEGLTDRETIIYRTAFRNGFRSGAALRQKIKKLSYLIDQQIFQLGQLLIIKK